VARELSGPIKHAKSSYPIQWITEEMEKKKKGKKRRGV
jgi:hypothetical protein